MRRRPTHHRADRQRGSALLLALLLCGIVAGLASAAGFSSRLQTGTARDVREELQADLAAQSGFEFAQRQLVLDPRWRGTGQESITLPLGGSFVVDARPVFDNHEIAVSGSAGGGHSRLAVDVAVDAGNSISDKALVFLGDELSLRDVHVNGDLILADALGVVMDWQVDAFGGDWVLGGPEELTPFSLVHAVLNDELFKYTDTQYTPSGAREKRTYGPVYMPAWDLDGYLIPGDDKVIINGGGSVANQTFTKTVVFHLGEGETLSLEGCVFTEGVVVWAPRDWDLRSGDRNEVQLKNCMVGNAADPHVGLLAPACTVKRVDSGNWKSFTPNTGSAVHGFSFIRGAVGLSDMLFLGQLVVVQKLVGLEKSDIIYHNQVAENLPGGIEVVNPSGKVRVGQLAETYL